MDIRYANLPQFINDVRNQIEINQIVRALEGLPFRQVQNLRVDFHLNGHSDLTALAVEMLQQFKKD